MKKIGILFLPAFIFMWVSCGSKDPAGSGNMGKEKKDSSFTQTNQQKKNGKDEDDSLSVDERFFMKAVHSSHFEVMLGELALKKGTTKIKRLAKMIIKDHQLMMDELELIGKARKLKFPRILDNEHQNKYSDLAKLEGEKFDKKYAEMMVKGHEENIEMFEKQTEEGEDKDFVNFASAKLGTLETHLDMARQVDANVHK